MRTPSGTLHVVDFKKSQIVSAIQPKDYWDDKRHWEIKNNIDTLEFRVFENTDHAATLVQQNLVLKEVRGGRIVPYVITEAEKDSDDKSLMVYASGEWIQLAKAEIIEPQKIESKTLKQCMEIALKGTKWEIGKTEHDGSHSMTIDEFTNPLDLLKKIAASFELEIQYRAEVVGSQIVVRYVDMVKKRGRDTRKEVTVGKDLLGIKCIENSQNICTALLGYVKKDNGEFITISEINNGVPYLVDDAAYQRWNEKGKHKFAFYTPQTENEDMSPQRLMTLMKTEMNKLVNTSVSYEVQAQSIGRVFGLAHELINEGDAIRIIDEGFTPKLYLEARAIAGDESFKDPKQDKYIFGNYREIIDQNDELRRLYQKILSSLYDKVPQELFDQLKDKVTEQNQNIIDAKDKADQAQKESQEAKDLAEATVEYVEQNLVDIIESVNPPTANLKPNKTLWRDISGGKPGILKIWTGTTWEPVVPDTGPLQQIIKDAENEINTLKETVKDMPDKTWLNRKLEGKADKSGVYTKDYINENLVGKQIYETDKQANIKAFSDMNTKYEQTAGALKLTATKDELKQTNTNVANVTKTVNEVKITTDENSKKITKVEGDFNNMKIGSVNLAIDSEYICDVKNATANYSSLKSLKTSTKIDYHNKKLTLSYILTGNITGKGSNPWMGAELQVKYVDGETQYLSLRRDGSVVGTTWRDAIQSGLFTIKDKDVAVIVVTTGSRDVFGNFNISHVQLEEGNVPTAWHPATEEAVSTGDFTKVTNEIKQTADTNSQTITKVEKKVNDQDASIADVNKKTNEIKQTVDKNSQAITTLSTTQGKQGELIQSNKSSIEQLNNEIKLKVTETQMEDYIGAIGHVNMVSNSAFEERTIDPTTGIVTQTKPSIAKWEVSGTNATATVLPVSARNHGGYNSVKIENSGQAGPMFTSINQTMPILSGSGAYICSVWIYTDNASGIDEGGAIEMTFRNGSTQVSSKLTYFDKTLANNTWTQLSVKLDAPTQPANVVNVRLYVRKNGRVWLSQPMVVQGTELSTFMENPKDISNYDQLVGEIAKKVATSDFNNKVSQMETTINQQSNRIDLKAEVKDVYTKIEANGQFGSKSIVDSHTSSISLMADQINQRVVKGDITSTINQTAQSVLIQASKIYLDGYIEAKHLKAQTLQGVTIQTAPQGSGANQIRLNAQNMTLYGSNQARGYFGFINRTDSNIQSALILGNDYASSGTLNGSLVLDQTTIAGTQWTNSVASIGIATGRSGNDILKSSYINFYRYDGGMELKSQGEFKITNDNGNVNLHANATGSTTGFINLSASKDINFTSKRGYFNFYTSENKSFPAMVIKDLAPTNQGDVDFNFANQLTFRVARHPDYVGDGLQIKNGTGTSWGNMKLGILRTMGNIGCNADVYAKNFINTSTRKVKTNIEDLPFSALKKVNNVRIKQYNLISDVEKYNAGEIDVLPVNYGMIAEDTDEVFTTKEKDAVTLYDSVSITMQAVQELDWKVDNMQFDIGMLKQKLEAQRLKEAEQEKRIMALEELVGKLINETTTKNITQTEQP